MKKFNKKGFTLIEMLVVIAIIAVLVAIIIPVVTNSTDKAAAATNAANLRSLVAEANTKYISNDSSENGNVIVTVTTDEDGEKTVEVTVKDTAPKSKKCNECVANLAPTVEYDEDAGTFVAKYEHFTIEDFARFADGIDKELGVPNP